MKVCGTSERFDGLVVTTVGLERLEEVKYGKSCRDGHYLSLHEQPGPRTSGYLQEAGIVSAPTPVAIKAKTKASLGLLLSTDKHFQYLPQFWAICGGGIGQSSY